MITGLAIIMSFSAITRNPLSAQKIIPRIANRCPKGFASDGDYCYRIESKPSKVMPKAWSRCPTGFVSDGDYCISIN
jgi:hypothetical protein